MRTNDAIRGALPAWTLATFVALNGACGGSVSHGADASGADAAPPDLTASENLCMQTGGSVMGTYCSANPPFAQYTCSTGNNGTDCADPEPTVPECVCGSFGDTSMCFDPVLGCVATGGASGTDAGSADAGPVDTAATAALCTATGGTLDQTFCSALPPFAAYTCATGGNGNAVCDPAPQTTEECVCKDSLGLPTCFDPVNGCVPISH
jgi:hypothetical protein